MAPIKQNILLKIIIKILLLSAMLTACADPDDLPPPDPAPISETELRTLEETEPIVRKYENGKCNHPEIKMFRNNLSFTKTWQQCGREKWGFFTSSSEFARRTANCLRNKGYNMTPQCAQCFGDMAACSSSECWHKCMGDSNAQECIECGNYNCGARWERCAGMDVEKDIDH